MKRKFGTKSTTTAVYTGVFLLIMSVVAIGYQPPEEAGSVANTADSVSSPSTPEVGQPSVDEIVAVSVAAKIADKAKLPVAPNIANQAVSLSVQSELAQTNSRTIAKPQIVQPSADSRTVLTYTVKKGDSVKSIAEQHGIGQNTVKWANNLSGSNVRVGAKLKILPVDGVMYKVQESDTIQGLAKRFGTSVEVITVFNDLELSGLVPGKEIILPSGELPEVDRPGYTAPRPAPVYAPVVQYASGYDGGNIQVLGSGAISELINGRSLYARNSAALGNCTWWAIERRAAMGRPLPGGALGNAADWAYTLSGHGHAVNKSPARGAIMQNGGGWGGYGHVAIVESVNADGSLTVSEMNYGWRLYQVNYRTIPASAVPNFNYIH